MILSTPCFRSSFTAAVIASASLPIRTCGPGEEMTSEPTELKVARPVECLSRLIEQSPWLLADRAAAPGVLALLERAARSPAYLLRLGHDTYGAPAALRDVVSGALAPQIVARTGPGA